MKSRLNEIGAWIFEAAVVLGLWVGTVSYLRTVFHAHFGIGTEQATALLVCLAAVTVYGLWRGVALCGPLSMPVSELTWSRSLKMMWLRLFTVFVASLIIAAAVISILVAFATPSPPTSVWVGVGAVALSTAATPILAVIQRADGDRLSRGISTGIATGIIVAILLFLMTAPARVFIFGAVVSTAIVIAGFLLHHLRSRSHLRGVPRWSLIRASEFIDAAMMSTTMLDSTRAQVYVDQRGLSRRPRLPTFSQSGAINLVWGLWSRTFITSAMRIALVTVMAAFGYRILGPTTGIVIVCLGVVFASHTVALAWADWDSSPGASRMYATVLPHPSITVFFSLLSGLAVVSIPVVAIMSWGHASTLWVLISLLSTVSMMLERSRDAHSHQTVSEGGYVLTPDGLIVPMGMFSTITAPWVVPSIAIVVGGALAPIWALSGLAAVVTWGVWYRLKRQAAQVNSHYSTE
ncbi:MAG: hypothetical protein Q4P05_07390 [Actinomycetaceae bacterium]|nr:hypothetical protein [Actinomycetaceae bacterium]